MTEYSLLILKLYEIFMKCVNTLRHMEHIRNIAPFKDPNVAMSIAKILFYVEIATANSQAN